MGNKTFNCWVLILHRSHNMHQRECKRCFSKLNSPWPKSCKTKLWAKKYQYIQVPNLSCPTCNLVITRKKLLSSAYLLGLILEVSDHCKMHLFLSWQYTSCLLHNYTQFQTLSARKSKNTLRKWFFPLFLFTVK